MSKNIDDVRDGLFDAIARLKAGTITVAQARAEGELYQRLIETGKLEHDVLALAHKRGDDVAPSPFLPLAPVEHEPGNGIVRILQHRIKP